MKERVDLRSLAIWGIITQIVLQNWEMPQQHQHLIIPLLINSNQDLSAEIWGKPIEVLGGDNTICY